MKDASTSAGQTDLERLAARLAMLASKDGEADNAGRAFGAMAQRIGLSGGELKRIFLAGAERDRLERELSTLRQSLAQLDAEARCAVQERDVVRAENRRLRASLDRVRAFGLAGAGALVFLVVGMTAWTGPSHPAVPTWPGQDAPGFRRVATVRPGGALLFGEPERAGPPLAALPAGQRVGIRRLVWKSLFQWAEIEVPGGRTGYVLTTEIDLS